MFQDLEGVLLRVRGIGRRQGPEAWVGRLTPLSLNDGLLDGTDLMGGVCEVVTPSR